MTLLDAHLDQISLCSKSISELSFPGPKIFTNALLAGNHDITALIRDTEQHERALFSLAPPPLPKSGAGSDFTASVGGASTYGSAYGLGGTDRRKTGYGARQPDQSAGFPHYDAGVHSTHHPSDAGFAYGQQAGQGAPPQHYFGGMISGSPGAGGAYAGASTYNGRFDA